MGSKEQPDVKKGETITSDSDAEEEKDNAEDHRMQIQPSGRCNHHLPSTVKLRPARFKQQYQRKPTQVINPPEEDVEVVDLTTDGDEYIPTPQRIHFRPRPGTTPVLNGKPKQYGQLHSENSNLQREPIKVTNVTLNGKPLTILAYTRNPLDDEIEDQAGPSTGSDSDLSSTSNNTRKTTNRAQTVGIRRRSSNFNNEDATEYGEVSTEQSRGSGSGSTSTASGDEHAHPCVVEHDGHCAPQQCKSKETEASECQLNDVYLHAITSLSEAGCNGVNAASAACNEEAEQSHDAIITNGDGDHDSHENNGFIADLINEAAFEEGSPQGTAGGYNGRDDAVPTMNSGEFEGQCTKEMYDEATSSGSPGPTAEAGHESWGADEPRYTFKVNGGNWQSSTSLCTIADQDISHSSTGVYEFEVHEIEQCPGTDDDENSTATDTDPDSESDIESGSKDKHETSGSTGVTVSTSPELKEVRGGEEAVGSTTEKCTDQTDQALMIEGKEVGFGSWSDGQKGFTSFLDIASHDFKPASPEIDIRFGQLDWNWRVGNPKTSSTDEDEVNNRSIDQVVENMLLSDGDTFLEPEPTTISLSQPIHTRKRPKTKKKRRKHRSKSKIRLSSDSEADSTLHVRTKSKRKRRRKEDKGSQGSCTILAVPSEPEPEADPDEIKLFKAVIRIRRIDDNGFLDTGGIVKIQTPSKEAQASALNRISERKPEENGVELRPSTQVTADRKVIPVPETSPLKATRYGRTVKQPVLLPGYVRNTYGSDESN